MMNAVSRLDRRAGAPMHPHKERGPDLYPTSPEATPKLIEAEPLPHVLWEPCCGTGTIVKALRQAGHRVVATDLHDWGCPRSRAGVDFLTQRRAPAGTEGIVFNPPYRLANAFVRHALTLVPLVVALVPLTFQESIGRSDLLEGGALARIHVFRERLTMMHRCGWTGRKARTRMAFNWLAWERDHRGDPTWHRI